MDAILQRKTAGGFVSAFPTRGGGGFAPMRGASGGFSGGLVSRSLPVSSVASPSPAQTTPVEAPAVVVATEPPAAPAPDPSAELEAELIRREQSRAREHAAALAELEAERQKMRAANTRLGQLAGELQRLRAAMVAEMRAEASEILLQGARRLAHESLRADESLLAAMAIDAAAALGGDERVVRVNPDDVAALEGQLGDRFKVVADPKIEAGCIVEGHGGSIEATVEAAAAALRADTEAWRRAG